MVGSLNAILTVSVWCGAASASGGDLRECSVEGLLLGL